MNLVNLPVSKVPRWATVAIHALVWVLLYVLPLLMQRSPGPHMMHRLPMPQPPVWAFGLFSQVFLIALFYFNAYFLMPRLLNQERWASYFLAVVGLVAATALAQHLLSRLLFPAPFGGRPGFPPLMAVFPHLLILACSIAFRLLRDNYAFRQRLKDVEHQKLQTELYFLRSQINPHFLFNTLNNLVALARLKSDKLEPAIIKLSGLMHYMLYDSNRFHIALEKEIEYLHNYIDLQRLRLGPAANITFVHEIAGRGGTEIPPMLLIPFVENAIKHGNGPVEKPQIQIKLSIADDMLDFSVVNSVTPQTEQVGKVSGLGLANVRRRLELLYPGRHHLECAPADKTYSAHLHITLS